MALPTISGNLGVSFRNGDPVAQILLETLEEMDLAWPKADFDVAEERRQVEAS